MCKILIFNKNKNCIIQELVFLCVYDQIGNEDNLFYWNSRNKKIALLLRGKRAIFLRVILFDGS